MISLESASQEEQNGTKFSSVAPSSEELQVWKEYPLTIIVNGVGQKLKIFTSA